MPEINQELKSEVLTLWNGLKAEFETESKNAIKGIVDPLLEEKVAKMNARMDELQSIIEKPNVGLTSDGQQKQTERAIKAAFNEMLRKGRIVTNAYEELPEIKSMISSVDAQGGYLVTPDSNGRIVSKSYETSLVRQYASVQQIGSDTLDGLIDNDEADSGWVGEQGTRSDTNTPELGKWRIEAFEQYAHAKISQKLLDDASVDVGAWLENKIAQKFARVENTAFVAGTGVTKPRGFTSYATAATSDDTRAWGTFEHVLSGASADFASSNPVDKIFDMVGSLKPAYLPNARFYTNRAVITKMRKLKQTADTPYLWSPSVISGTPSTLNGYEVVVFPDMPALAADSLSLAFGDLAETYLIVDRLGIRMLRDNLTAKPFIIFYATKRTGGGVVNFESLKFMKFNS